MTTGTVFHSGDAMTYCLPIYEEYSLSHDFHYMNLGGRDVTDYMMKLLTNRGYCFSTRADRELVRDLKEKFSLVPLGPQQDLHSGNFMEKKHQLPDGQVVTFDEEIASCPQAMFKPSLIGSKYPGIHVLINSTIMHSELDVRKELYSSIVITGGNTLFPEFLERVKKELSFLAPRTFRIKFLSPPDPLRKYSSWIGASIISSKSDTTTLLRENGVTTQDYKDTGIQCLDKLVSPKIIPQIT